MDVFSIRKKLLNQSMNINELIDLKDELVSEELNETELSETDLDAENENLESASDEN